MTIPVLSRRGALRLGALALGGMAFAPRALAAPTLHWPLRLAYARIGPKGFIHIRSDEQAAWSLLKLRLGGLIDEIEPIQPSTILSHDAPDIDGGANCAMVARQMAANQGFDHVILYATNDGQKTYPGNDWLARIFATIEADIDKDDRATGEAHLLDVGGGPALISVSADAAPRDPLNLFDGGRNPERETLTGLTQNLERRLQDFARSAYESERSIGD